MKKLGAWLLILAMAVGMIPLAAADPTVIEPNMELQLDPAVTEAFPKLNPEVDGIDPLTGLPMGEEPYTPIALILDDSPEVFPHWGVAEAERPAGRDLGVSRRALLPKTAGRAARGTPWGRGAREWPCAVLRCSARWAWASDPSAI